MKYLNRCPECGSQPSGGLLGGCYMELFACDRCGRRLCYKCPDTNGGRSCPNCEHDEFSVVARIQPG